MRQIPPTVKVFLKPGSNPKDVKVVKVVIVLDRRLVICWGLVGRRVLRPPRDVR
jgi:hypothetical protein